MKGSPAEKAGLESGDLVTAIDGQRISKISEAMSRGENAKIVQVMKFGVRHSGQAKVVGIRPE